MDAHQDAHQSAAAGRSGPACLPAVLGPPRGPRPDRTLTGAVLAAVLALFVLWDGAGVLFTPLHDGIYDWRCARRRARLIADFPGKDVAESPHFVLHYDESLDGAWAPVVLACAERAHEAVSRRLGWSPAGREGKVPVLLHPTRTSLDRQFASRDGLEAVGAYWCGVVQVLSPRLWLAEEPGAAAVAALWTDGPLVHEYTHYVLDMLVPAGNYPRWFSEGLAQYVEYRETGYLWLGGGASAGLLPGSEGPLYSLPELGRDFDGLENTAVAYREAFLLTAYLVDYSVGWDGLHTLLGEMARGRPFEAALEKVTGLSPKEFESRWLEWLREAEPRYR